MGRRIFKKVYNGETLEKHLSFVYDGYKLIEERNALDNNAAVTINGLLDAEADAICNATSYQHGPDRLDRRAGSYKRKLLTTTGEVELPVSHLRRLPFETQII